MYSYYLKVIIRGLTLFLLLETIVREYERASCNFEKLWIQKPRRGTYRIYLNGTLDAKGTILFTNNHSMEYENKIGFIRICV